MGFGTAYNAEYLSIIGKVVIGIANLVKAASCAWALSSLVLFATEVKQHCPPFISKGDLVLKFLAIKGIVFFTFWQGIAVGVLTWTGQLNALEAYIDNQSAKYHMRPISLTS